MSSITTAEVRQRAMVRSFDGRPGLVNVFERSGSIVAVSATDETRKIGFPEADVREYVPGLFDKLAAAYAGGDKGLLDSLWGAALPLFQ